MCSSAGAGTFDEGQFAEDVLPQYVKHNCIDSFAGQHNLYGCQKVVHNEQGRLVKPERGGTEFQQPCFLHGHGEQLLEKSRGK